MSEIKVKILDEFALQIPSNKLPTKRDILKAICFEKQVKKCSYEGAVKVVVNQIDELWQMSGIPSVNKRTIQQNVSKYFFQNYQKLYKANSNRDKGLTVKLNSFKVSIR